jgi:hypothetical protein
MNHERASLLLKLASLVLAAAVAVGLQARERANSPLYDYALSDSTGDPQCGFDFVDLGPTGLPLAMAPANAAAAGDDRAGVLALAQPFEFYQEPAASVVASDNGYLAIADSLEREDGSDFSNDCGLPVRADNPAASQERIYLYHDDLRPQPGAVVKQAHFSRCPRTSAMGAPEACTVVEWSGFEREGPLHSSQPLHAQAVLYHGSHEIVLQYASVDDSLGGQATVGLQGFDGRAAREAGCNVARQVRPRQAVCFRDPRHPATHAAQSRRLLR